MSGGSSHKHLIFRSRSHRLRCVSFRHPFITDTLHEQTSAMDCQTSVTVTHKDLRVLASRDVV